MCTFQESGIFSGEDLHENPEARISADELLEIVKTTAVVQQKTESLVFA